MTNWQEIHQLTKDPKAVRILAHRLFKLEDEWSGYALAFLRSMAKCRWPLTTKQAEFLIVLRNETELYQTAGGFSIATLIEDCWRNREPDRHCGLSDENCEFIERIRGKTALRRPQLLRLFACCRDLGLIERYINIDV